MSPCTTCAEPMPHEQKFCGACGAAAGVELIDTGGGSRLTSEATVTRNDRPATRWYAVLGGLLVVVVAWSVFASSGSEADNDAGEQESAASAERTEPTDSTETDETTGDAAPAADPPVSDEPAPNEPAPNEPGPSTTSPDDAGSTNSPPEASAWLIDGPIGGTGLTLAGGSPLRLLDLDTGEVVESRLRDAQPVGVFGDRLVLLDLRNQNRMYSVEFDDLDGEQVRLESRSEYVYNAQPGPVEGTVVAVGQSFGADELNFVRTTFDVATGEVLDEEVLDGGFELFYRPSTVGEFFTPPTGGVYRRGDDGPQLVGPGRVVAQGDDLLLTETCDAELVCEMAWQQRPSFEEVQLPIPGEIEAGQVLADGRLLVFVTGLGFEAQLFDLNSGEVLAEGISSASGGTPGGNFVSVSDDASKVAFLARGINTVLDLDTGLTHIAQFEGANTFGSVAPLLVPTP